MGGIPKLGGSSAPDNQREPRSNVSQAGGSAPEDSGHTTKLGGSSAPDNGSGDTGDGSC
jgi:hypothetical protein